MSRPEKLRGMSTLDKDEQGRLRSGYALELYGSGGGDFLGLEELEHDVWYFHILKDYESPCEGTEMRCSLQSARSVVEYPRRRR